MLLALGAMSVGCQCNDFRNKQADVVDCIVDHVPHCDRFYTPVLDLNLIGRPEWCDWRVNRLLCPKCWNKCGCEECCSSCDDVATGPLSEAEQLATEVAPLPGEFYLSDPHAASNGVPRTFSENGEVELLVPPASPTGPSVPPLRIGVLPDPTAAPSR